MQAGVPERYPSQQLHLGLFAPHEINAWEQEQQRRNQRKEHSTLPRAPRRMWIRLDLATRSLFDSLDVALLDSPLGGPQEGNELNCAVDPLSADDTDVNPQAPKGGRIAMVSPSRASSFDKYNPFTLKGTAPPALSSLMLETLLVGNFDEPTTAYGLLAEDVSVAKDRLSVTFKLNPLARFHNGDPVLALDVKYAYERLTSKQAAPQFRTYFSEVKGLTVLGEREVRFDFKRANAELPLIVGSMPVFSHRWGADKPFDQVVTEVPIGSGPYRVGKVDFGKDIEYVRDPNHWAKDLGVRKGMFNFDRITYKM